ncbi:MAG: site-specific recombinase, partial [Bacteroidota bacterium]|nr:site-specific recombinase [Bacteroidota bacterium]
MGLFTKNNKTLAVEKVAEEIPVITTDSMHHRLEYLVELVKQIRPTPYYNYKQAELKFRALFYQLQTNKTALFSLRKAMLSQFLNSNFIPALTESGMVGSRGFLQEFITKLKHKLLPPLLQSNDFLYLINHVFYKHYDHIWVKKIDHELWINLFKLIGVQVNVKDHQIFQQLNIALQLLSHRTIALGLEKEVVSNVASLKYEHYPFLILDTAVQNYLQVSASHNEQNALANAVVKIVDAIKSCKQTITEISEQRRVNGTSLSQTYTLF